MFATSEVSAATRLRLTLAALWLGAMLCVGALVAPTLFALLPRQVAGTVAGQLFVWQAYLSAVCGALLALLLWRSSARQLRSSWFALGLALLLQALNHFVLGPEIAVLRDTIHQQEALAQGAPQLLLELKQRFGMLHGASSSLYLVQMLAQAFLCWRLR